MDDGTEEEFGPGDAAIIPPGHNAWVVGNEPVVGIDFTGLKEYAKSGWKLTEAPIPLFFWKFNGFIITQVLVSSKHLWDDIIYIAYSIWYRTCQI